MDLTLEKAKKLIRQKEVVKEQSQELDGETQKEEAALEELRQKCAKPPPPNRKGGACQKQTLFAHGVVTVDIKGLRDAQLPARFATAVAGGAIMVQCFSTNSTQKASLDSAFLDTVTNSQESAWSATVLLGKTEVQLELDTGAAVTAITEDLQIPQECDSEEAFQTALWSS